MSSTLTSTKKIDEVSSFRKDYKENIEIELGHVPDYDEEQESEIPKQWFEPIKDFGLDGEVK
jgi:hypothetical protein